MHCNSSFTLALVQPQLDLNLITVVASERVRFRLSPRTSWDILDSFNKLFSAKIKGMADYIALPRLIQKMHNIALTVKCIIWTKKSNTLEFGVTENSPKFQVSSRKLNATNWATDNGFKLAIPFKSRWIFYIEESQWLYLKRKSIGEGLKKITCSQLEQARNLY